MKPIAKQLADLLERHQSVAMATLVAVRGETKAKAGARMWIGPDRTVLGAVTIGGCVDSRALELMPDVIAGGAAREVELELGDAEAQAMGMTCGGIVDLRVERLERGSPEADAVLASLAPTRTLVIVGATDIAVALARVARLLGLRVMVVDGRDHLASAERFPDVDGLHVGIPSEIVRGIGLSGDTALVLVSHEYKYDLPILRDALAGAVGYVGMLGGRKRRDAIAGMLREDGLAEDQLARLRTPVGLRIGAETPSEIAVSIAAELIRDWIRGAPSR